MGTFCDLSSVPGQTVGRGEEGEWEEGKGRKKSGGSWGRGEEGEGRRDSGRRSWRERGEGEGRKEKGRGRVGGGSWGERGRRSWEERGGEEQVHMNPPVLPNEAPTLMTSFTFSDLPP